ncbi:sensor histidine kinase [Amycolatopsis sacchari]|uniref:sensor histidine kinase n=1 Tax=Amycolatopsis sacchari TaxID=115433 RepID=UPI003EBD515D
MPSTWVGDGVRGWTALRRFVRARPVVVDGLVAVGVGVGVVAGSDSVAAAVRAGPTGQSAYAAIALSAAALAFRRSRPVSSFAVSYAATIVLLATGFPYGPIVQLPALALYSLAAWRPPRVSGAVCGLALAVCLPLELAGHWAPWPVPVTLAVTGGWLVFPWLVGLAVRAYRRIRERADEAERARHVSEERLRIAKDVHDLVGHGLAVISMQAGVALHVLDRQPADVRTALLAIRETSRDALDGLRVALDGPDATRQPLRGLDELGDLVRTVNGGGLTVVLDVAGTRPQVPAAVDVAGYRIAQEALTNVVKHAAARRATVHVAYEETGVRLVVTDDGKTTGAHLGRGRGLIGMRERAQAVGGTLTARPLTTGGFAVSAFLPYSKEFER